MARQPEKPVSQMDLAASKPPTGAGASVASTLGAPPSSLTSLVEYQFGTEAWRCSQFDLLVAEFETVTVESLERFHQVAAVKAHSWKIVRRLFGIRPLLPSPDYPEDDCREWGRIELCDAMGLTRPQLTQSLDAVRGAWQAAERSHNANSKPLSPALSPSDGERESQSKESKAKGELNLSDDPLLKEFSFHEITFKDRDETEWFIGRVRDFEKVLREKMVGGMARNALLTDLRCRRLNHKLDTTDSNLVGGKDWTTNLRLAEDLAKSFNAQVAQILDLCPWASAIAGKMALAPVISVITQAIQEYHAKNSTRLVDGVFTATEIQVECRRSTQMPEPRYRAGMVVYLNAAKQGLFDPNWKPPFAPHELAKIDAAWKAAFVAASLGEHVPDLEADGPGGEYADLRLPEENTQIPKDPNTQ